MFNLTEDQIWEIFSEYIDNKGIVQHQIESYNYFVNEYLQRIFDEIPDIIIFPKKNEKYTVSFGQAYIDFPSVQDEGRQSKLLLPYETRMRDFSYDSIISVDIRETLEDTEKNIIIWENYHPKTFISNVPVMINSCKCNISTFTPQEKIAAGECETDPGGYFIIKGKERTLICQERINYNQIYVFEQKANSKFANIAEIRSMSDETGHSVLLQAKMSMDGKSIYFSLPNIKEDIPIKIVFRALNFSDMEIKSLINLNNISPEIDELISSILRNNREVKTKTEAIKFIGRNPLNIVAEEKKESYAEQVIDNELFPHLGNSNEKEKGVILGHMVNLLIKTYFKLRMEDDRDNLSLKRVEGPGTLIGDLFRMLLKRMIESAKKQLIKRQDIIITLSRINSVDNGLKNSFATGNWGVQKNNYIRNGVSQVLSRLSYSATLSHLRRVVIPIGKEGKNTKIRQLHPSQIFFIDPAESPEGQQVGIVKNLAMLSKLSTGIPTILVREVVDKSENIIPLSKIEVIDIQPEYTKIFVNGVLTGYTSDHQSLLKELKRMRKAGLLHHEISISYDDLDNDIKILSDDGRLIRPVFVIENGQFLVNRENYNKGWDYLVENGIIQYVDNNEVESSLIAMYPKDLEEYPEHSQKYTYCEIHPAAMLGVCTGDIFLSNHNQSPRNCYQTSMMKQALGLYATNYKDRVDTVAHVLHYPQKSLTTTKFNKMLKYDQMPNGINAIVAIGTYTGLTSC
jgi:DNA-directed RNA polymerase II subunit RPB2